MTDTATWVITAHAHIWPLDDLIEHEMSPTCPCRPDTAVIEVCGNRTYQFRHHSLDGREL